MGCCTTIEIENPLGKDKLVIGTLSYPAYSRNPFEFYSSDD